MKRQILLLLIAIVMVRPVSAEGVEGAAAFDFREVVKSAKDKVFPAVVFIRCIQQTHEMGRRMTQEISGSGVIISPDGEVLTNWHVIDKATEIRCLLHDGRPMNATIVGSDKDTDLALLKLSVPEGEHLLYAVLGDSTLLEEGHFVMAMGAPWGLARSVSIGIVSCTRRFLPGNSEYSLWLQTDAAISPGNSGGPLVNTEGRVVGINTLGVMYGGDTGFAIPSQTIKLIAAQLREYKSVNWTWTGLQLQPLNDFNRNIYFGSTEGVIVAETDPESPARRAGIDPRDRILRVNGTPLNAITWEDLPAVHRAIGLLEKYEPVTVELLRGGEAITVELTPREKGDVEGGELDCPRWDFTAKTINQFDNPALYFHRQQGVFVYGVRPPGNASNAGLRQSDIILRLDSKEIRTLDDVREFHEKALENIEKQSRVRITVLRDGLMRQFVLDFSRDYSKK